MAKILIVEDEIPAQINLKKLSPACRLKGQLNTLGQEVRNHGGDTDTQVNDVAVLQLLGNTSGDKTLDLRLIH